MKKVRVLYLLFSLVLFVPAFAHGDANSSLRTAQKQATKSKKLQVKEQKRAEKAQKRAVKRWKKQHPAARR